ncbi:sigma-70 family RNA polymerase sigma factor [Xylophilus rhododendri]|uniref:Sigma-70 family RNA polymerase sigma factor n=1 Tax=Xylophilus rhododendri TaxID=2697032 RepID=A0A857JBK6_9BURK|nr:sigma-70 family RNA polymerase sigma factor [Xylophilus rhododendri]QHJ00450.1 sigma-70 family RNA polymerase sigma factor [Xylophilus rhododendri]
MPERYYRELLRYFTRRAGDGDGAADLVQEAYSRVYALQRSGGAVLEPRAFLYHAGRNIAATAATRQAAERRMLDTLALVGSDSAPSVERTAIARQQLQRLIERLERMPRKRREVFILVRIHGWRYHEAAERLGLSDEAVERHVMRGIFDCAGLAPGRA